MDSATRRGHAPAGRAFLGLASPTWSGVGPARPLGYSAGDGEPLMKYRLSHVAEYIALRVVAGVFRALPERVALAVAAGLAAVAHVLARSRVRVARERIRQVFGPGYPEAEIRRVARRSLRNLFFNAVELVRLPRLTRDWADRHVDLSSFVREVEERRPRDRGAIYVIPHMGNWDLGGVIAGLRGHPVFFMAARQRNPLTDAYLNAQRAATGIEVVLRDDPGVVRQVLRRLKEGRILCILIDLRSRTPGLRVRFLGREANLVPGLGLFARQAKVPVFPGVVRRVGWTRHVWDFGPPVWPDLAMEKEADWLRITQQVMDIFDRAVRAHPDQYFWYNRRWVLDPLEERTVGQPQG